MPLVVLDPIVLVNTAKSPSGMSAKLLALLAYGRTCAYLHRVAAAELTEMADIGDRDDIGHAGSAWGMLVQRAYDNAVAAHRELEHSIPPNHDGVRPGDWRLAVSRELHGRMLNRVGELREQQGLELDGGIVWGQIVLHASARLWETWSLAHLPDYTHGKSVDGNVSIHTALRMGANMLITRDPAVCSDPSEPNGYSFLTRKQAPEPQLCAVHLDWLVAEMRNELGFDLENVDATVLERIGPGGTDAPRPWPPRQPLIARTRARARRRRYGALVVDERERVHRDVALDDKTDRISVTRYLASGGPSALLYTAGGWAIRAEAHDGSFAVVWPAVASLKDTLALLGDPGANPEALLGAHGAPMRELSWSDAVAALRSPANRFDFARFDLEQLSLTWTRRRRQLPLTPESDLLVHEIGLGAEVFDEGLLTHLICGSAVPSVVDDATVLIRSAREILAAVPSTAAANEAGPR